MKEQSPNADGKVITLKKQYVTIFDNFIISMKIHKPKYIRIRTYNSTETPRIPGTGEPVVIMMRGVEYTFSNKEGGIFIYRDCARSETFQGNKLINEKAYRPTENYIDKQKIEKVRSAGADEGKWIKIRTSFKKSSSEATNDQYTAQHNEARK